MPALSRKILRSCWLALALFFGGVHAGEAADYAIDLWRSDDGVPQNNINSMAQSADGYLWMATDEAVARFDGVRFVTMQVDQFVDLRQNGWKENASLGRMMGPFRVFSTRDRSLWLAGGSGALWRWSGREFRLWRPPEPNAEEISRVFEIDGNIIAIGNRGGIFKGENEHFVSIGTMHISGLPLAEFVKHEGHWCLLCQVDADHFAEIDSSNAKGRLEKIIGATCIAGDSAGNGWIGTSHGIYVWKEGKLTSLPSPTPSFSIAGIAPSSELACWAFTERQIWCWQGERWFQAGENETAIGLASVHLADAVGGLWIAPSGSGCWHITKTGDVTRYGPDDGIPADPSAGCIDQEGNVWLSIYRVGIARLRIRRFNTVKVSNFLHSASLWSIAEDDEGAIWFGPEFKGPVRWKDGVQTEFTLPHFTGGAGWAQALTRGRDGVVWVAANQDGVYRFENGAFIKQLPWPKDAGYCSALYQDRRGVWWMGSNYGLQSWEDGAWKNWGRAEGLASAATHAIVEDAEGHLWVGLYRGGMARLDGERFVTFGAKEGLESDSVYTFIPGKDGSLWIGGFNGLSRLRKGRFTHYSMAQGLPDHHIVQLLDDARGYLWLGTQNGLCRVPLSSFNEVDSGASASLDCLVMDHYDGLPTRVFQGRCSPACLRAHDGALWFLTAQGAAYCHPEQIVPNDIAPTVLLEAVRTDHQRWGKEDAAAAPLQVTSIAPAEKLVLPAGMHLLEFEYTATSLTAPEKVRFSYRMEGLDRGWVEAGTRRTALYSFLPPGAYRFQVRACNNDGKWNPRVTWLDIVIEPFFWQRGWFIALSVVFIAAAAGGIVALWMRMKHRRRMARLELEAAREGERIRIARDLHDDLGASLTEIGMLAADAAGSPATQAEIDSHFTVIADKAQSLVTALDTIVWAVDPQKDTLSSLASFLGSFVEEYSAGAGLDCRVDIQASLPESPLPSDTRHSLFLAVKEAVHNAVKHAHARRISFGLRLEGEVLEIRVSDDGRGFDSTKSSAGNGLQNMRQRLANLLGFCEIQSQCDSGTVVTFRTPLPAPPVPL